jgi:predicted AAA+ superfamily ATPase
LREEILEEQIARSAPPFRRFLEVAAQDNGQILNYAKTARDVGVSPHTVQSYYQILEDTLLAERIDPFLSRLLIEKD